MVERYKTFRPEDRMHKRVLDLLDSLHGRCVITYVIIKDHDCLESEEQLLLLAFVDACGRVAKSKRVDLPTPLTSSLTPQNRMPSPRLESEFTSSYEDESKAWKYTMAMILRVYTVLYKYLYLPQRLPSYPTRGKTPGPGG